MTIGFMPLLDCALLVAAVELGFAADNGLDIRLVRESSWANIRDRVAVGHFDAAHMLGPMVVAEAIGAGPLNVPLVAAMALGLGGNAITVSNPLWSRMQAAGAQLGAPPALQARALAKVISARARAGDPALTLAMVYPYSCHHYELRHWLLSSGINVDSNIHLVVIPPPLLVDALRSGQVDGFCVGEPWSSIAVAAGIGTIAAVCSDIWKWAPEKVLGMRRDYLEKNPQTVRSLIRSVEAASRWAGDPDHHEHLAELLSRPCYVGVPAAVLRNALAGQICLVANHPPTSRAEFLVLAGNDATTPWPQHAELYYSQMCVSGQTVAQAAQAELARAAFRLDVFRAALEGTVLARAVGAAPPSAAFSAS
jgi:two-component system, oxyanion-binding sensor